MTAPPPVPGRRRAGVTPVPLIKRLSERLGPWISVVTFVVGTAWGLYQYTEKNKAERVGETLKFVREFQTVKVKASEGATPKPEEMTLRDAYYALNEPMVEIATLLREEAQGRCAPQGCQCPSKAFGSCATAMTVEISKKNRSQVKALNYFLDALAFCALEKTCDPQATASYFGGVMFGFVQNNCTYFEAEKARWRSDRVDDARIVEFLLRHHADIQARPAAARTHWFRCVDHRAIEDEYVRARKVWR